MIAAQRLLVVGAGEPEVKALEALELAPDVSTLITAHDVVAGVISYLASPAGSVFHGQTVPVTGGRGE